MKECDGSCNIPDLPRLTQDRMHRLLWTPEYESYMNLGSDDEPIVLVESPFVVESKTDGHNEVDKMVYVCLTTESLLIGEENLEAKHVTNQSLTFYDQEDMTTACRINNTPGEEGDWDLQDFRLKYLYPLQHVRLSIQKYREAEGDHVMRLRIGEADDKPRTWYLELAGRHREKVWSWWKEWIFELDERRKEERHRVKEFRRSCKSRHVVIDMNAVEFGELNLDWHRDNHGLVLSPFDFESFSLTNMKGFQIDREIDPESKEFGNLSLEKREQLRAWHIQEHKKRTMAKHVVKKRSSLLRMETSKTADTISVNMSITDDILVPVMSMSVQWVRFPTSSEHLVPANEEPNSCSSVEDIASVGSLVNSDVDWQHGVSDEINTRLVLCTGDLFEKSNIEIHGHGHIGRVRPMASDTALPHLLEFEETNLAIDDKHHTFIGIHIDKEKLHRTYSVPDILEGEAAFLEDDYKTSQITHHVALDNANTENEDKRLHPHIINGHVLLVTKKELRLEKEILKFREEPHDLDFTTCIHEGKRMKIRRGSQKRTRQAGMVQKYRESKRKRARRAMEESLKDMIV